MLMPRWSSGRKYCIVIGRASRNFLSAGGASGGGSLAGGGGAGAPGGGRPWGAPPPGAIGGGASGGGSLAGGGGAAASGGAVSWAAAPPATIIRALRVAAIRSKVLVIKVSSSWRRLGPVAVTWWR